MIELLLNNPLLLLFVVAGIGYPLGRVRIAGSSLGVAAVLFVGLAVGALHPDLKIPEQVYLLGVVLYIYTLGLSNGPVFLPPSGAKDCAITCSFWGCSFWPPGLPPLLTACSASNPPWRPECMPAA